MKRHFQITPFVLLKTATIPCFLVLSLSFVQFQVDMLGGSVKRPPQPLKHFADSSYQYRTFEFAEPMVPKYEKVIFHHSKPCDTKGPRMKYGQGK